MPFLTQSIIILYPSSGELGHHCWEIRIKRQLIGSGSIDYAALEGTCSALFVASDQAVKFISDTEKPVIDSNPVAKGFLTNFNVCPYCRQYFKKREMVLKERI